MPPPVVKWIKYCSPLSTSDGESQARSLALEIARCCRLGYGGLKHSVPKNPRQRTSLTGESVPSAGIVLVDTGLDAPRWSDLLCNVQVVPALELMPQALQRLSSGAANLACYDRAGRVLSAAQNILVIYARIVIMTGLMLPNKTYGGKTP
ncbi:hypothetical protein BD626DRAFT_519696 [Schizophyllum amplum]|uniref:Uncharacterized protein n=1 Tax=Schizophyllum amplum TaxID=97359 RepID=A0A550BVC5_9AGAR|nr:hypothetical protein BD626DRAFT_519696 [Auriculariopsis ampla]